MAKANPQLDTLLAELQNYTPYRQRTDAELLDTATQRYQSAYGQNRLAATQAQQTSDLALANQLTGLGATYDRQRADTQEAYDQAFSQTGSNLTKRGMQRSSYGGASLAGVLQKGAQAQADINTTQANQEANIGAQRTLLSQQLAQQLQQYDASQQADILAYMDQLRSEDYTKSQESEKYRDTLAQQIYQYQQAATPTGGSNNNTNNNNNNNNNNKDKPLTFMEMLEQLKAKDEAAKKAQADKLMKDSLQKIKDMEWQRVLEERARLEREKMNQWQQYQRRYNQGR